MLLPQLQCLLASSSGWPSLKCSPLWCAHTPVWLHGEETEIEIQTTFLLLSALLYRALNVFGFSDTWGKAQCILYTRLWVDCTQKRYKLHANIRYTIWCTYTYVQCIHSVHQYTLKVSCSATARLHCDHQLAYSAVAEITVGPEPKHKDNGIKPSVW